MACSKQISTAFQLLGPDRQDQTAPRNRYCSRAMSTSLSKLQTVDFPSSRRDWALLGTTTTLKPTLAQRFQQQFGVEGERRHRQLTTGIAENPRRTSLSQQKRELVPLPETWRKLPAYAAYPQVSIIWRPCSDQQFATFEHTIGCTCVKYTEMRQLSHPKINNLLMLIKNLQILFYFIAYKILSIYLSSPTVISQSMTFSFCFIDDQKSLRLGFFFISFTLYYPSIFIRYPKICKITVGTNKIGND